MLDIHSHILPKMDDGAKNEKESISLLKTAKQQGVTTIISTSHFYADRDTPEKFLKRRAESFEKIRPLLTNETPEIMFGSEVLYFYGISRAEDARKLKIEGTNLILIELPFHRWSDSMLDDLLSFQYSSGLQIILAHIERYRDLQDKKVFRQILDQDFYIQCNADAFLSRPTKKLAFKLYEEGRLQFIGSDCHSTDHRPPHIAQAKEVFCKKYGEKEWSRFCNDSIDLFRDHMR